jgi:hypothetical protein
VSVIGSINLRENKEANKKLIIKRNENENASQSSRVEEWLIVVL